MQKKDKKALQRQAGDTDPGIEKAAEGGTDRGRDRQLDAFF